MEKSRFKLVIFDLDGTLVNTLDDMTNAANRTLVYFGMPEVSKNHVKYAIGSGIDNFFNELTDKQINIKKAGVQFAKNYLKNLTRKSRLYSGIIDVLQALKRKKTILYVVTNKPQVFSEKVLKNLRIKKYFKKIIGAKGSAKAGEKERLKPSPYYIKKILKKEKIKPGEALIIGDSKTDVLAAKNAKTVSCAVLYGFRKYEELKKYHPDFFIKKPMEILKIIK